MLESGGPTTPGSVDDEKLLVPSPGAGKNEVPWYRRCPPPFATVFISLLQIIFFLAPDQPAITGHLRFEPDNQEELWRFLTYMLVHSDWHHLMQNVLLQYLFAYHLEKHQERWKVVVVYATAVATGALGAACVRPELVIGASAGVYGLLVSHLAHLVVNTQLKYKLFRLLGVTIIVIFDVTFNVVHVVNVNSPLISWGAHIFGAVTGFLVGLVLFSDPSELTSKRARSRACRLVGGISYSLMLLLLLWTSYRVRSCEHLATEQRLVYFC